jgi:hypothetical protein
MVLESGYGFSRFKGGPRHLASTMTRAEVIQAVDEAETATGFAFRHGNLGRLLDAVGQPLS